MVRAYIQDNHSVAKTDESQKVTGGISFGVPGIHKNCLKIDVASLYPSIMRQWHVNNPSKDPKDVFFTMVDYNTKERLKNKKLAKETKEKHYNDLQESQKIFINSCYGLLGTNRVNYNNFSDADFITSIGRRILSLTMYWATGEDVNYWFQPEFTKGDEGYLNKEHDEQFEEYLTLASCTPRDFLIVNADTDSITFKKRDETEFSDKEREDLIKEINSLLPEMISYEDDGYFEKMVVTKAKNYVLYDGEKIKYKGSSFKDAKKEPKLKQLMKDVIEQGLIYEEKDWTDIYKGYVNEVSNIKDIKPWATKKSVTETLQDSDRLTETKVMDAIEGYDLKVGDKVFIYNAIDGIVQDSVKGELVWSKLKKKEYEDLGLVKNPPLESCTHTVKSYCYYCNPHLCSPKMIPNRVLRHVDEFDGNYDVDHYLNRCYDTISILSNVIDIERIKN
jgi:DNA polymerase elongation subunit (family B)